MNKFKTFAVGILLLILTSFTSDNLPKTFVDLLERSDLTFQNPSGLEKTKTIENRQMNYEYAVKYPNKKFEVRYAIRPLDNLIRHYKEKENNKNLGDINIHPNKLYTSLLQLLL